MKKVVTLIEDAPDKVGETYRRAFYVRFPEFAGLAYKVKQKLNGGLVFPTFKSKNGKMQGYIWWEDEEVNKWLTGYLSRYGVSHDGGDFAPQENTVPKRRGWEDIFPGATKSAIATGAIMLENRDGVRVKVLRTRVMQSNFFRKGVRREPYILLPGYGGEVRFGKVPRKVGVETRKSLLTYAREDWADKYGTELGIQREPGGEKTPVEASSGMPS